MLTYSTPHFELFRQIRKIPVNKILFPCYTIIRKGKKDKFVFCLSHIMWVPGTTVWRVPRLRQPTRGGPTA